MALSEESNKVVGCISHCLLCEAEMAQTRHNYALDYNNTGQSNIYLTDTTLHKFMPNN